MKNRWMIVPVAMLCLGLAAGVVAQGRESQLRTVRGIVVDKDENPIGGAVLYLKNLKTLTVKTYIADSEGRYRYSGLDPNVDYEIHAEHRDMASQKRSISSLDGRREITVNLKVDRKKSDR